MILKSGSKSVLGMIEKGREGKRLRIPLIVKVLDKQCVLMKTFPESLSYLCLAKQVK